MTLNVGFARETPEPIPPTGPGEPYPVPDPGEPYPVPDPQRGVTETLIGGGWVRLVSPPGHKSRPLRMPPTLM
jgi:hypothetical protein